MPSTTSTGSALRFQGLLDAANEQLRSRGKQIAVVAESVWTGVRRSMRRAAEWAMEKLGPLAPMIGGIGEFLFALARTKITALLGKRGRQAKERTGRASGAPLSTERHASLDALAISPSFEAPRQQGEPMRAEAPAAPEKPTEHEHVDPSERHDDADGDGCTGSVRDIDAEPSSVGSDVEALVQVDQVERINAAPADADRAAHSRTNDPGSDAAAPSSAQEDRHGAPAPGDAPASAALTVQRLVRLLRLLPPQPSAPMH